MTNLNEDELIDINDNKLIKIFVPYMISLNKSLDLAIIYGGARNSLYSGLFR